ncbi:hypothetical protein ACFQ9B_34240, partial [Streptomyces sp. NPDC056549]
GRQQCAGIPVRIHSGIGCGAGNWGGTLIWKGRWGFMRGDKRQIQTAVLGSPDSEEPLVLPLEAIELDAFRRQHEHDTYWCGLLLGGCGLQLTTKLYTDRVCHFAYHPGPDGHPHVCGRHARSVASADHLYVKPRPMSGCALAARRPASNSPSRTECRSDRSSISSWPTGSCAFT